jgi:hypothetical protein
MESFFKIVAENPYQAIGVIVLLLVSLFAYVRRKTQLTRDAERQLAELSERRGRQYDSLRPPQ